MNSALAGLITLVACGGSSSSEGPRVEGDPVGVVGAHEHGVARLALVVEGPEIFVTLEAPGDALFGFEREPETEDEWALVTQRVAGLEAGLASVLELPAELECRALGPVRISDAPERHEHEEGHEHEDEHEHEEGHEHEDEHEHEEGHEHEDEHSEVSAEVTIVCNASPAGRQATLRILSLIPDLEQVDLTVLTETGQAAARVPGDASFSF